jgi:tripartite-type tricarboxylate transporter receptor subunit TctC
MMKSIFMGLLLFLIGSSSADAQTPYFQGKTIRFVVGYPPGSTHDLICGRGSWDLI